MRDFDEVSPRVGTIGDGHRQLPGVQCARLKTWADEVAAANTDPAMVIVGGYDVAVEEIGPPQFVPDIEIWEQQPEESEKQWHMFQVFRDMPPWKRNKQRVQRQVGVAYSNGTGQAICYASSYWRWEERVQAYDVYTDRRMTEELYQRKLHARIATADVGQDMRLKASAALAVLTAIVYKWVINEDGERVRVKRSALRPNEIARLAEIGVKLERLGLGETGTDVSGALFSFTQVNQTVNTSDEELLRRAHEIIEARTRSSIIAGKARRTNMDGD